jgi:toxin ParE2
MNIVILPEAEAELQDAVEYYDGKGAGLSDRLIEAYFRALDRVRNFPEVHPKGRLRTRKCKLQDFPYTLVYRVHGQLITIFAVAHQSRHPGYWRGPLS